MKTFGSYLNDKLIKFSRLKNPFNMIFDLVLFPGNLNSHSHFYIINSFKNFKWNTWLQLYKITCEIISVYTWNTWTPLHANQSKKKPKKKNMNLNLWIPNFELWLCTCYNLALSIQIKLWFNLAKKKTKRNKTDIQFDGKNNTLDCGGVLVLSKERNETIFFSNVSPSSQAKFKWP